MQPPKNANNNLQGQTLTTVFLIGKATGDGSHKREFQHCLAVIQRCDSCCFRLSYPVSCPLFFLSFDMAD